MAEKGWINMESGFYKSSEARQGTALRLGARRSGKEAWQKRLGAVQITTRWTSSSCEAAKKREMAMRR